MAVNLRTPVEVFSVFKLTTRERWDIGTPLIMAVLSVIGVAFIYSAQLNSERSSWEMQIVWLIGGIVTYVGVSLVDYRFWLRIVHWFYAACIVLLILVILPGVGTEVYGAQRWLRVGPIGFQPSDPAKIAVLLVIATILMREKVGTIYQSLGVLGKLALAVGIPMFLILLQPDLKSVIVLPPMVFSMLYVSRLSTRFFMGALAAFTVVVGIVAWDSARYINFMEENGYSYARDKGVYQDHSWLPLRDYQRNRIITFIDPDKIEPLGAGWNLRQSLISVGTGGLLGKGWTEGTQAQLGYLPPRRSTQRLYLLGHRRGERTFGKPHGSQLVWFNVV